MISLKNTLAAAIAGGMVMLASHAAYAIPALQLGPGMGTWNYDNGTQTWVTNDNPFNLSAFANADPGNGAYAWDAAGAIAQTAYLVLSAVPKIVSGDGFDVTVDNDGGTLSILTSGFGAPPLEDANSLASHGIFDTYFEVYEFNFDESIIRIGDTQPGQTGTGNGYKETFDITINALLAGVTGIHIDLFTVSGNGVYGPGGSPDKKLVNAFAPFSHDAQFGGNGGGNGTPVSEPGTLALFGLGLAGVGFIRRRQHA